MSDFTIPAAPWRFEDGTIKADDPDLPLDYRDVVDGYGCRQLIAETVRGDRGHLLAAAPEMLEALEVAERCMGGPMLTRQGQDQLVEMFREVIAKAKGQA